MLLHTGHYTCHTKSVITKPQNVLVLRDIMCAGYVAGGNTRFFGEKAAGKNKTYTAPGISQAITDRLSFVDDASGEYESMLAFAVPYGHGDRRDQVYSLSARLLPWEVTKHQNDWYDYFPGGKEHQKVYSQAFGLEQLHFGEDVRAAENMEFISSGSVNNSLCFLGPHRVYSQWSQTFYELTPGQGYGRFTPSNPTLTSLRVSRCAALYPRTCSDASCSIRGSVTPCHESLPRREPATLDRYFGRVHQTHLQLLHTPCLVLTTPTLDSRLRTGRPARRCPLAPWRGRLSRGRA